MNAKPVNRRMKGAGDEKRGTIRENEAIISSQLIGWMITPEHSIKKSVRFGTGKRVRCLGVMFK